MRDIRVASVQFEHADGDKAANLAKVRAFSGSEQESADEGSDE